MADTGWLNLTTFTSVDGSVFTWSTPSNAAASDDTRTAVTLNATASIMYYLQGVGLVSSTVPSGAAIVGVEIRIEGYTNGAYNGNFETVQLVVGGTRSGSNLGTGFMPAFGGSDSSYTFGGPTNLAGLTLTDTDVNAPNFGAAVRMARGALVGKGGGASTNIDTVQMKVYYTGGGGGGANTTNFFQFF